MKILILLMSVHWMWSWSGELCERDFPPAVLEAVLAYIRGQLAGIGGSSANTAHLDPSSL